MIDVKTKSITGNVLQLRQGKSLGINFPLRDADIEGFKIYNAVEKEEEGKKTIEWKSTSQQPEVTRSSIEKVQEFIWRKILADLKERMENDRKLLIEEMKEKRTKKSIKRRLNSYKKRAKRKYKTYKKRAKKYLIKRTKSGRGYSII
ncbi:MAG: hypothetical protein ACI94Y_000310 [Maribacter sp.]|jgi:hypothetical protein